MQERHERQRSICLTTSGDRRLAALQHVLDQIDAPARRIEFVAEQQIGRAGGGAEAAMNAGAENLLRTGHGGVFQLIGREVGLHRL